MGQATPCIVVSTAVSTFRFFADPAPRRMCGSAFCGHVVKYIQALHDGLYNITAQKKEITHHLTIAL